MQTEFKVLMHDGKYVNDFAIGMANGIHYSEFPTLYEKGMTLETLLERIDEFREESFSYTEQERQKIQADLKECQLVTVTIQPVIGDSFYQWLSENFRPWSPDDGTWTHKETKKAYNYNELLKMFENGKTTEE